MRECYAVTTSGQNRLRRRKGQSDLLEPVLPFNRVYLQACIYYSFTVLTVSLLFLYCIPTTVLTLSLLFLYCIPTTVLYLLCLYYSFTVLTVFTIPLLYSLCLYYSFTVLTVSLLFLYCIPTTVLYSLSLLFLYCTHCLYYSFTVFLLLYCTHFFQALLDLLPGFSNVLQEGASIIIL